VHGNGTLCKYDTMKFTKCSYDECRTSDRLTLRNFRKCCKLLLIISLLTKRTKTYHNTAPLVQLDRQISVWLNPLWIWRVHNCLACRSNCHWLSEIALPGLSDPCHLQFINTHRCHASSEQNTINHHSKAITDIKLWHRCCHWQVTFNLHHNCFAYAWLIMRIHNTVHKRGSTKCTA